MTRRPKTPRTFRQLLDEVLRDSFGMEPAEPGYRRHPKGRRAKSGQWWRRGSRKTYPWNTKPGNVWGDYEDGVRVVIDESADPIPMDVLERCDPKVTSGKVIEATTNDRSDKP